LTLINEQISATYFQNQNKLRMKCSIFIQIFQKQACTWSPWSKGISSLASIAGLLATTIKHISCRSLIILPMQISGCWPFGNFRW